MVSLMSSDALRQIQSQYASDSDDSQDSDNNGEEVPGIGPEDQSSSSDWSLSSDEEPNEATDDSKRVVKPIIEDKDKRKDKKTKKWPKTKGELSLEDLPPIEKLSISVGVEELSQLGSVTSIVDQLVVIQSFRLMPALDLDSVLFLKDGQPLGQVFDVFGPVVEPRYAVRFDTNEEITARHISVGTPVYFATEHQKPVTSFVFAEQLRQMKGSDASWKDNNEPPDEVVEYSDDETERRDKQKHRAKRSHHESNGALVVNQYGYQVPPNTPNNPYSQSMADNIYKRVIQEV
ncbi:unnamed protein product [Medioppia subpectinata]|uniref:H/ACA ribonucleoprotein complex subunit n=1 Tax=Medioppia subpectinata TaxID=1979941 RepID=A0A7R9KSZ0_9ACAR|nr:unnamed protein product [Medioppia subpectinata]CAG2107862.1 unnamed protein product [Medioppia subpectinata]